MRRMLPAEVYKADLNARYLGISVAKLMENAGKAVADEINKRTKEKEAIVVSGKGNNGGDGFVAARHLCAMGYNVKVILLAREEAISSNEARENFQILKNLKKIPVVKISDSSQVNELKTQLRSADVIVDGILGIGIKGAARGLPAKAIKAINQMKDSAHIFSIDVPSGLDVSEGRAQGPIVQADVTVTFSGVKQGLTKEKGGEIIVKRIGIPPEARKYVGPGDLLLSIGKRDPWSHKGDFGKVLVIGGSTKFSGAPALAALSSLRSGADLAIVAAPEVVASEIRSFSPDLIVDPYPGKFFKKKVAKSLAEDIQQFDSVILGPGLGRKEPIFEAVEWMSEKILEQHTKLLVDADALKALGERGIPQGKIVLTPHAGEFRKLFGETPPKELEKRGQMVKKHANQGEFTVLLKGHVDTISDGQKIKLNNTGNAGMTVGGTGDVLSGIVGALLARGLSCFHAASCGAFLCGMAGDKTLEELGVEGLTASEIVQKIPEAFKWFRNFA